jgi:hypothetical protein
MKVFGIDSFDATLVLIAVLALAVAAAAWVFECRLAKLEARLRPEPRTPGSSNHLTTVFRRPAQSFALKQTAVNPEPARAWKGWP